MVLLRRVIGDTLRARRLAQHRTLREVATAANVSLGYLSEIERGQKEASSELLGAICDALGLPLSDVLREVSHSAAVQERVASGARAVPEMRPVPEMQPVPAPDAATATEAVEAHVDGDITVTVRHDSPLKTTLLAKRLGRGREVVRAA